MHFRGITTITFFVRSCKPLSYRLKSKIYGFYIFYDHHLKMLSFVQRDLGAPFGVLKSPKPYI